MLKDEAFELHLMKEMINKLPDIVLLTSPDQRILFSNTAYSKYFDVPSNAIIGKKCYDTICQKNAECDQCLTKLSVKSKTKETTEVYIDSIEKYFDFYSVPIFNKHGDVAYVIKRLHDITKRKQMEQRVRYLSYFDNVTGIHNRTFFEMSLRKLDSKENLPLSLVVGDANGLKLINDAFGHKKGDELLSKTAKVLKSCIQQEGSVITRWGGDEFAIILPKTSKRQTHRLCKSIKKACKEAIIEPIPLSIALGYSTKENTVEDINIILKQAEDKMYRNKLLESKSARSHAIISLKEMLHEKTFENQQHAERLQVLASKVGEALKLSDDQLDNLNLLASLHAIGKIAIDNSILTKPSSLTDDEWEVIKKHPEIGYRIANSIPEINHIAEDILCHHEHWNGNGYPQGLKEEEIPLASRIITIVDSYDVMVNDRPYKKAMNKEEAIKELRKCSGSQFDPQLVELFISVINAIED